MKIKITFKTENNTKYQRIYEGTIEEIIKDLYHFAINHGAMCEQNFYKPDDIVDIEILENN